MIEQIIKINASMKEKTTRIVGVEFDLCRQDAQ
jgi:hypothetical protein